MQKEIVSKKKLNLILKRLACQLVENHGTFKDTVVIAIQPRGSILAEKIREILKNDFFVDDIKLGKLDISFFRDDLKQRENHIQINQTLIDFVVDKKNVVLIDDVLHTGRSVRAALSALNSFGRPLKTELMVLVDRRFSRQLPIQPDYKGIQVDAIDKENVAVYLEENKESIIIERKP